MTIEKGKPWGSPAADAAPPTIAEDDAALASLAFDAHLAGTSLVARVASGDLLATLGVSETRPEAERIDYPLDLGLAYLGPESPPIDEPARPFIAHLIAGPQPSGPAATLGRVLGHGPPMSLAILNAAWLGDLRLGPRAHPNDGLLDITEGRVRFGDRREATKRARSGSHLPHPDLRSRRLARWEVEFERSEVVSLDGVQLGRFRFVRVELLPDALTVVA